jgi:broad specificity phosphatase PhoE
VPRALYFITHPNVVVSRDVPVPQWPLSEHGRARMRAGLAQPWIAALRAIYCSTERKAVESAEILAQHLGIGYRAVPELGENDRSSTGFLPPAEFERVADEFFARPEESIRGWERAVDAQARILAAVRAIDREDISGGSIAIVAHGAVGTLLYCSLAGVPISRRWDQPANGGGNFYRCTLQPPAAEGGWRPVDQDLR